MEKEEDRQSQSKLGSDAIQIKNGKIEEPKLTMRTNNAGSRRNSAFDAMDGQSSIFAANFNNNRYSMPHETITTVQSPSGFRLAQHMTIAGSFLDFALFVADVEHLKFLLDAGEQNVKYYKFLIVLIAASLALQLVVVFMLFIVGFRKPKNQTVTTRNVENAVPSIAMNVRGAGDSATPQTDGIENGDNNGGGGNTVIDEVIKNGDSSILNHVIIVLVTIIAIINVFITVFGDRSATTMMDVFKHDHAKNATV